MFKEFVHKKMSARGEGSSNDRLIDELLSEMVEYGRRHIVYQAVLL